MNIVVKASLILAGAVGLFSIVFYLAGLHESFLSGQLIFLVGAIGLNVGVILWALGTTAAENGYGMQLMNAAGIGLVGGFLVVLVSWLLLAVVFPGVLGEMREAAIAFMDASEMSPDQVEAQMKALDSATPMSQSIPGGVGTFFTSLVSGAIFAIFKRKK